MSLATRYFWMTVALAPLLGAAGPPAKQPHPRPNVVRPAKPRNPVVPPRGPGAAIQQFEKMSPADRERAISKLPPARQQKVRDQLQRDQLPPERKEQLQRLWQLPPEEQEHVRDRIRDFNQSAPDRKRAMRQQLRQLRDMTPEQRNAYMQTDEFRGRFSADEQDTVRAMSRVLPPE